MISDIDINHLPFTSLFLYRSPNMDPPSEIVGKVAEGNVLKVDHEMDYPVPNGGKMLTLFHTCNLIETVKSF